MSSTETNFSQLADDWQEAKILYPLYCAVAREFVFETAPCASIETTTDVPDRETIEQAREWFALLDGRIAVHQLRQFLQTTPLAGADAVRQLLSRHLRKPIKTDTDRDKIDFLLVQYFSLSAPSLLDDADVDLAYVAQVLEPALGDVDPGMPAGLEELDEILQQAQECTRLSQLLGGEILERGRGVKARVGKDYFQPGAMIAFTRFSFLMRRVFFRLMHGDLNAILEGLTLLERQGITSLDCSRAQFSEQEPTARLRMICQSWKVMFQAEYSSGQPLRMIVDMRDSVEAALADRKPAPPVRVRAAHQD